MVTVSELKGSCLPPLLKHRGSPETSSHDGQYCAHARAGLERPRPLLERARQWAHHVPFGTA
eukprot:7275301-Pyramimonas_sp.AAC.2